MAFNEPSDVLRLGGKKKESLIPIFPSLIRRKSGSLKHPGSLCALGVACEEGLRRRELVPGCFKGCLWDILPPVGSCRKRETRR